MERKRLQSATVAGMKNEQRERERGTANDGQRSNSTTRTNNEEKDTGQKRAKEVVQTINNKSSSKNYKDK